ncbi:MAG: hypothetical protein DHS20C04_31170 [Hyphococcus sp.]|nr:MAG: hypothetical protein DHS20C04_31170 [Marinicaulis sp.]
MDEDLDLDYRVAFADQDWEPCLEGTARLKRIARDGKVFRLVEMTPVSRHSHWCETGHVGMIVEGELEIAFDDKTLRFSAGDALVIPHGAADRHRPRALTDRALMFLIEDEVH